MTAFGDSAFRQMLPKLYRKPAPAHGAADLDRAEYAQTAGPWLVPEHLSIPKPDSIPKNASSLGPVPENVEVPSAGPP